MFHIPPPRQFNHLREINTEFLLYLIFNHPAQRDALMFCHREGYDEYSTVKEMLESFPRMTTKEAQWFTREFFAESAQRIAA